MFFRVRRNRQDHESAPILINVLQICSVERCVNEHVAVYDHVSQSGGTEGQNEPAGRVASGIFGVLVAFTSGGGLIDQAVRLPFVIAGGSIAAGERFQVRDGFDGRGHGDSLRVRTPGRHAGREVWQRRGHR